MPKTNKGGRDFKPGKSGNPNGRPTLPEDIKQARALNKIELDRMLNEMIHLTKAELQAKIADPKTTALELMACSVVAKGVQGGDHMRLGFLLDRLVGKVKDQVEVSSPEGFRIEVVDYTFGE